MVKHQSHVVKFCYGMVCCDRVGLFRSGGWIGGSSHQRLIMKWESDSVKVPWGEIEKNFEKRVQRPRNCWSRSKSVGFCWIPRVFMQSPWWITSLSWVNKPQWLILSLVPSRNTDQGVYALRKPHTLKVDGIVKARYVYPVTLVISYEWVNRVGPERWWTILE